MMPMLPAADLGHVASTGIRAAPTTDPALACWTSTSFPAYSNVVQLGVRGDKSVLLRLLAAD